MFNPLAIKILVILALVSTIFGSGHHLGARGVQAKWDHDKLEVAKAAAAYAAAVTAANEKHVAEVVATNNRNSLEVSNEHQNLVNQLNDQLVRARAAVRAAGLRIPRSVCAAPGATGPEAAGSGGRDGDTAGTVALPEQTSNDLLDLTAEADRLTEVARACQGWIKKNGFYGAPTKLVEPSPGSASN